MNMSVPCAYFSVYYKRTPVYANDWIFPIQAGFLQTGEDLGFLKDCDGINIAERNPNFGELTAHYWVWKNFLPSFSGDYIGFGHYRRFLSLRNTWSEKWKRGSVKLTHPEFSRLFDEVYTLDSFRALCGDADAIVPPGRDHPPEVSLLAEAVRPASAEPLFNVRNPPSETRLGCLSLPHRPAVSRLCPLL